MFSITWLFTKYIKFSENDSYQKNSPSFGSREATNNITNVDGFTWACPISWWTARTCPKAERPMTWAEWSRRAAERTRSTTEESKYSNWPEIKIYLGKIRVSHCWFYLNIFPAICLLFHCYPTADKTRESSETIFPYTV